MFMVDFSEIMKSKTVCEIELLAEKMGIEQQELEQQLRKKVIGKNYPITIFENVIIVTSENLTEEMMAELNQLIKPNFEKLNQKEGKRDFLELLTQNNVTLDITHQDINNLLKALKEVDKI